MPLARKRFVRRKKPIDKRQNLRIRRLEYKVNSTESKFNFFQTSSMIPIQSSSTALFGNVTDGISQGNTAGSRSGDKIAVKMIKCNHIHSFLQSSSWGNFSRVIVMHHEGFDNALTVTGDMILQSYSTTDTSLSNLTSNYNPDYVKIRGLPDTRKNPIRILWDSKIYTAGMATGAGTNNDNVKYHRKVLRFKKPLMVKYSGATSANGAILVCVFPGCDTTSGSNPFVAQRVEVYYNDG